MLALNVIGMNREKFQEVELLGHRGIFTDLRVDQETVPVGVYCYELRHGDDDSFPATVEQNVTVNYFGAVVMAEKLELSKEGHLMLSYDDFGFTGEELTMLEYQANFCEEPECFPSASKFARFMSGYEEPFELKELEAQKLLDYMEECDYLLGYKDGRLFKGDLSYEQERIRWREETIDDVIVFVAMQNYDMMQEAQQEMENPKDFIDFVNKKNRFESLEEDDKILDKLFDRTSHGKKLNAVADMIANEFIEAALAKEDVGETVKSFTAQFKERVECQQISISEYQKQLGKAR